MTQFHKKVDLPVTVELCSALQKSLTAKLKRFCGSLLLTTAAGTTAAAALLLLAARRCWFSKHNV
jgi:hypothetical protein